SCQFWHFKTVKNQQNQPKTHELPNNSNTLPKVAVTMPKTAPYLLIAKVFERRILINTHIDIFYA
ncbi:hypothetical protein, partial [Bartonella sp. LJL80]